MSMYYSTHNVPKHSFGGKADGLIFLSGNGFRVPPFYIIPNDILQQIISEEYTVASLCAKWINDVQPDKNSLWAVRSSADVEDGKNKSYAGLFSTEINCRPHELVDAFQKVIAGYKQVLKDIPEYHDANYFGFHIVLQQMISGEISGVGFSVNPLEQVSEHPIITIIPGLGIKLVSGEENAMMIDLSMPPKILSDEKEYCGELFDQANGYTKTVETQDTLFEKIRSHLKELRQSLQAIDQLKGHPVDTEFTIYNNKIYWLQVRPITTLIPRGDYNVLDNSNMDVNYPGIVMPLTISFVQHSYSNAYIHMCRFLGAGTSFIEKNHSLFKNTIRAVKGNMYYNVTSYQQLLYQMPFGNKTSRLFPKMLGAEEASFQKPSQSASFIAYIRLFLHLIRSIVFIGYYKRKYTEQYTRIQEQFDNTSLKGQSHTALIHYFKTLENELSTYWYVPILNSLFTMVIYNRLTKILSRSRLHEHYPNFLNDSLMGSGQVVSMEIVRTLQELTRSIHENSDVKKVILEKEDHQVLPYLKEHHKDFFDAIMSYIHTYGERSDEGELKIETVNYREDPTKFVAFLRSNVSVSQHHITAKNKFNYLTVLKEIYKTNTLKRFLFKTTIAFTIKRVRDRENFRFIRTKTFDMVRQIFREIDSALLKSGSIINEGDSLYLHFEELMNPASWSTQYKELIATRKVAYKGYQDVEHPIRYHEVHNELYPISEKPSMSKNGLDGVACSSGITQGEVLLVTAQNIHELEITGKILVAPFFEPGWVGLFSRAEGIISERGSLLSHTSILCREMGIPAIIGAKKCTKNLRNGDIIKMNGATGAIEKIQHS
ncbi:PEP/pyruvate-binding domain-containing protein [Dokdonia ponticola]|uniref:PEP/pyruvate-binding domain-containing protein n=1 Tax=Dokdonia ponticola TaxID=2041041 RepID=A0ABV9I466_9FLAO